MGRFGIVGGTSIAAGEDRSRRPASFPEFLMPFFNAFPLGGWPVGAWFGFFRRRFLLS